MEKILAVGVSLLAEAGTGWMHGAAGSGIWSRNGRRVICCPRCGMDRFTEISGGVSVKADGLARHRGKMKPGI